jgi:hypothetical protein
MGGRTVNLDDALAKVKKLYTDLTGRRPRIETLDDYYEGKQPLAFASRDWAEFHKDRYVGFSDNWVSVVADALNERLKATGVVIPGVSDQAMKILWGDWDANDMPEQSSQGFLESIIAGRSFVIVWGDENDEPTLSWEHPSQVVIEYAAGSSRQKVAALKSWVDGKMEYATLYTPDEVWKFERRWDGVKVKNGVTANGIDVVGWSQRDFEDGRPWDPRESTGDDAWPLPNPLGLIPVVEFPNRPRLGREPISDVSGTKAMQDAINLLWAYLFAAADLASMPARVILGQEPPKVPILDKSGQVVGEREIEMKDLKASRFLWLTGEKTKIGEFSRADLSTFTAVVEIAIGHIGAQTRTPAHYFVANKGLSNVNGETLTATETPLVKKAEEFELYSQRPFRDMWELCALVRGDKPLADAARRAETVFANPAIRSEAQLADALSKKKDMGYPLEYLMELDGMDKPTRDRVLEMKRREQENPELSDLVDRLVPGGGGE